jgi:hypothetical protein
LTYTCLEKYVKKLLGKNEIEDSLKRLDTLTQEEARMAIAEVLRVTHSVDDNVRVVLNGAQDAIFLLFRLLNANIARRKRCQRRDATDSTRRKQSQALVTF